MSNPQQTRGQEGETKHELEENSSERLHFNINNECLKIADMNRCYVAMTSALS